MGHDGSTLRRALADGLGTPGLRRLEAAWAQSAAGSWTFFVALAVYAYGEGGATAVAAAALVRMAPAGLAAPFTGVLADRRSRRDVLLWSLLVRAALAALIFAAVAQDAPLALVLVLAAAFTVAGTAHKPAQAALGLELAGTPAQAAAANALWTATDNAAFLVGALLGGALVAAGGTAAAFAAVAVLCALAVLPVRGIARDRVPGYREQTAAPLRAAVAGFRHVAREREVRDVVGFLTAATLVEGMVDVLVVVVAIDLLDLGNSGVGWLNAAWGLGGLVGGSVALGLLGRGRLSAGIVAGGVLVGASLLLIAAIAATAPAIALLVVLGVGYALIESASVSLLQRHTSDEVLARAFGVVESGYWLATGLGAILAPVLLSLLGPRAAVAVVGCCLPALVVLRWRALAHFEVEATVPQHEYQALRGMSIFAALPVATVESLARRVVRRELAPGDVVIRGGAHGEPPFVLDRDTFVAAVGESR